MKKLILALALVLAFTLVFTSCTTKDEVSDDNKENVENNIENVEDVPAETSKVLSAEELEAAVNAIYEKHPMPFMTGSIPAEMINADSFKYYTGLDNNEGVNAVVVSESMMGSQAYSLVLLSVEEGNDAEAIATSMINGIDQRKWMCVEADLIRTVVSGNTVMLVMIDSSMDIAIDPFVDAFTEVVGEVTFEAKKN